MRGRSLAAIMVALRLMRVTKKKSTIEQAAPLMARKTQQDAIEASEATGRAYEAAGNEAAHDPCRTMGQDEKAENQRNESMEPRDDDPTFCANLELQTWRGQCEAMAETAIRSGGLSHDWCVELYSESIDRALPLMPDPLRGPALLLAAEVFDYRTPMEREQINRWNAENGYCLHGITLDCCPLGCGSILDD